MKLINKFTVWYVAITTLVMLLGGVIFFKTIQWELDREARRRLNSWVEHAAHELERGISADSLNVNTMTIRELDPGAPLIAYHESDSLGLFAPRLRGLDRKLTVGASYKINGRHYYISTFDYIAEPDEIIDGIRKSLIAILIILLLFVGLVGRFISNRILSPFQQTLQAIKSFSLKQRDAIRTTDTNTTEFRELNHFLEKMTAKALHDYRTLKEFSENASHEIQTPLAVIRGKLELLMETEITEEQAGYVMSIHQAVQKLSSVNHSLVLLTKLENLEYTASEPMDFSMAVENAKSFFQELIAVKSLALESYIEMYVYLAIHPFLADTLLNNLISNAIRHNIPDGTIYISLSKEKLVIRNTGNPPDVPTDELFKRFRKNNQSSDSTGLGLSIVKQICDLCHFTVHYTYADRLHTVEVKFPPAVRH
jgi:signal transduction histidine kinase